LLHKDRATASTRYSLDSASAVTVSETSSINTTRKSTTRRAFQWA